MPQQQPQMFGVPGGVYTMNNMNPYQQQQMQQQQQQPNVYQQQQPSTGFQQGGMNQVFIILFFFIHVLKKSLMFSRIPVVNLEMTNGTIIQMPSLELNLLNSLILWVLCLKLDI